MSDFENKNLPAGGPENLATHCAALQRQVNTLLLGLVIVSGTLSVFLWRQSRYAGADLDAAKAAAGPAVKVFKESERPAMDKFEAQLAEFSKTHPDFNKVLGTFRLQLNPNAAPAPAPVAAPKAK